MQVDLHTCKILNKFLCCSSTLLWNETLCRCAWFSCETHDSLIIVISQIFDLTLMSMSPIGYDVTLMLYFNILGQRPHCIWTWWFVWYIGRKPIAYDIYIYMIACVGRGPWSTWLMRCFVLSEKLWSMWVYDFLCWARICGTHEYLMFLLSKRF